MKKLINEFKNLEEAGKLKIIKIDNEILHKVQIKMADKKTIFEIVKMENDSYFIIKHMPDMIFPCCVVLEEEVIFRLKNLNKISD